MPLLYEHNFSVFKERRNALITLVKNKYVGIKGHILLFANFEQETISFRQEPSFYYLTGITEPATALTLDIVTGKVTLFVPNFGKERAKWVEGALEPSEHKAQELCVDSIEYLGEPCQGYQCHPFFSQNQYSHLIQSIQEWLGDDQKLFVFNPESSYGYVDQRFVLQRIEKLLPALSIALIDIANLVAQLRRKKTNYELELLYKAIDITSDAHETAARLIKPNAIEYEVQAGIEYTFISSGGTIAFPSIVGSGKNSTVLHYNANNGTLKSGDLVVVDIGAQFNYYCADITRTYPVSGAFTKRQRELYDLVLETQEYIASIAKPGMWLSNKEHEDESLNHLAKKFLHEKGYGHYFIHGIGHYLGLDVHDVGSYAEPLAAGDVFTIEPGIYIPEESLGIRIEDDYWVIDDGVVCLSENLPKTADDIEAMMKYQFEEE